MPKITLIIPVYNAEHFLSDCIESVLSQDYNDYELIIVDDGSLDNTSKICEKYVLKDNRIKYVYQSNMGASSARNRGVKEAQGEFIIFVDADDLVGNSYISNLYNPEYDLVIGGFLSFVSEKGILTKTLKQSEYACRDKENIDCALLYENYNMFGPVAKLFKKKIINDNNIKFPELNWGEDGVFVAEYLIHCNSVKCIEHLDYYYRNNHNPNSLSSTVKPDSLKLVYKSRNAVLTYIKPIDKSGKIEEIIENDIKRNCEPYLDQVLKFKNTFSKRYRCLKSYLKIKYIKDELILTKRYTPKYKSLRRFIMLTKSPLLISIYFSIRERLL